MSLSKRFAERGLSVREIEVATIVATKAGSNKDVANHLFIHEKTVKFHLTNIYKKLGLKSRAKLIVWAASQIQEEGADFDPTDALVRGRSTEVSQ